MKTERLGAYRKKRDFTRTGEPFGADDPGGFRFVVHKHHATADHYDLRLNSTASSKAGPFQKARRSIPMTNGWPWRPRIIPSTISISRASSPRASMAAGR